jgi:hypothetical protein
MNTKREKLLKWLNEMAPGTFSARHEDIRRVRVDGSGEWFLYSGEFQNWVAGASSKLLICPGMRMTFFEWTSSVAGAGKSVLMLVVH